MIRKLMITILVLKASLMFSFAQTDIYKTWKVYNQQLGNYSELNQKEAKKT